MKFYPYEKGGSGKVLAMLKGGGGTKSFKVVLTPKLEILAIVMRGRKKFPPFKSGGRKKFYPVLRGGGRKKFQTRDFPIL